jgi:hypothetical protein
MCREKNLVGRALELEETGAVTIGARRGREVLPSPTGKDPLQGAHTVRIEDALRAEH